MYSELLTPEPTKFQCRHIFTDGRRCGSPALRGPEGPESFCYYHHNSRRAIQNAPTRKRRQSRFTLPMPEDRSAVQQCIGEVLRRIAANEIDPRRASLLLYGLQTASLNLSKATLPDQTAEPVCEVTHDPEHGLLAPPAELGHDRPKSSIELLLDQFDDGLDNKPHDNREDKRDAQPVHKSAHVPTIDLQASAEPNTLPGTLKSTRKLIPMKTLRKKVRGRGLRRSLCAHTTPFGRAEAPSALGVVSATASRHRAPSRAGRGSGPRSVAR